MNRITSIRLFASTLCVHVFSSIYLTAGQNPLIERELTPLTNPGFENGLVGWSGGKAGDDGMIAGDGRTECKVVEMAADGKKSLCMHLDAWVDPGKLHLDREFKLGEQGSVYVGLRIKTQGDVHAVMGVTPEGRGTVVSPGIKPDTDWQEVGVVLNDPAAGGHSLKLRAFGKGKAYFDDMRLKMIKGPEQVRRTKGPRYTPVSKRQDKPDGIAYLLRHFPELTGGQVGRLLGTTKSTINAVRERTHWNSANIRPRDPVILGLCKQVDLDDAIRKARKAGRKPAEAQEVLPPDVEEAQSGKLPDWMSSVTFSRRSG